MSRFKKNVDLADLVLSKEPSDVSDIADSSCTTGYDNDGSTGLEIFENGFDLGLKAGVHKEVWAVFGSGTAWFFIGSLDEVTKRVEALGKEAS